jgi:hypothetical protein
MGRRQRKRGGDDGAPRSGASSYHDEDGNTLVLRGTLRPRTRAAYARIASGQAMSPGATREDAWQRAVEFLFEHLAESWTIAGTDPITNQRELLGRLRMASAQERSWVRTSLRAHCEAHFPDVAAP